MSTRDPHLFDDPRYTVDALIKVQTAIVDFNDRYALWREQDAEPSDDLMLRLARDLDGLDLSSVVPVLREAAHMIRLLAGTDDDGAPITFEASEGGVPGGR